MIRKIFERLNSINSFSKKIIRWGCFLSLIMCICGIIIIEYNALTLNKIATHNIGSTMIYSAIVMFAQVVIGGLVIDYFGKLLSNHE